MRMEQLGITVFANSLAMKKSDGTCVEILNSYMFDKVKYVNFIKPGSCDTQKLTMKEFNHLFNRVNPAHLRKILIPAYNVAIQKNLFSVDTSVCDPSFEVNHRAEH